MLKPIIETSSNKITLSTWPFLRGARIEDGYDLGFSSKYTNEGAVPDKPLLTWIPPGKTIYDWETVSPAGWSGTTEIIHLGKTVFQPSGARLSVDVGAFKNSFWNMQDTLIENIQQNQNVKLLIGATIIGIMGVYFYIQRRN